jgi:hypothetical protein
MSRTPIDPSTALERLREAGFNIQISDAGFLLVRDVPYVNSKGEIARGVLVSTLELAGDIPIQPADHQAKFVGEHPCDRSGTPLPALEHSHGSWVVGNRLTASHNFSRKPGRGHYEDY